MRTTCLLLLVFAFSYGCSNKPAPNSAQAPSEKTTKADPKKPKPNVSQDKRPNVVFIFSDDHSYEAVSAYGGRLSKVAPTPNLDRIAKEGIRFDNCFVTNAL
ncbi:uncharacterized protein METZ01_LOCUS504045 [marine metagenome]|uniref:Sulfatase N-terminal domain-containing protein n=1 Tax=marine metagenome TaxID=408172 RepID=A0A383E395_9ZZZZ